MSITKLFIFLPDTINFFSDYINDNSAKGARVRYLLNIYNNGITEFTKNINTNDIGKKLIEFEKVKELDEWIISGLSKKEQDEIFNSESEDEITDSP